MSSVGHWWSYCTQSGHMGVFTRLGHRLGHRSLLIYIDMVETHTSSVLKGTSRGVSGVFHNLALYKHYFLCIL